MLDYFYQVRLEKNVSPQDILMDENLMNKLDSIRENSLFSNYNVSQKTLFTQLSQNVNHIQNARYTNSMK